MNRLQMIRFSETALLCERLESTFFSGGGGADVAYVSNGRIYFNQTVSMEMFILASELFISVS